jgi:DNA-binding NarL/FixJ family response regulator
MDSSSIPDHTEDVSGSLVGREREFHELLRALDRSLAGHGGLALVSGEAGIGKTSLVHRLRDTVSGHSVVLEGHCYDLTVTPPFSPWIEAIRSYDPSGSLPDLPPTLRPGPLFSSVHSMPELFDAITSFFTQVAQAQPLVIILEDLHWSDGPSVELLRHVSQRAERLRLLVVATYRDVDLPPEAFISQHLVALVRETAATRVELRPLDHSSLAGLVRARYPLDDAQSTRLVAWLASLSDGNPLYAIEILRSLDARGVLVATGGAWVLGDLDQFQIPPLLRQVVGIRTSLLPDSAQRHLQIAAVIGETVEFGLWSAVCERTLDELVDDYEHAVALSIVTDLPDGDHFRFSHALLRQALYEGVSAVRRRLIHAGIADAMLAAPSPDPDSVAYHLGQARDPRQAFWLIRAGDRAQRSFAWRSALDRFQAAIRVIDEGPRQAPERGWLLFRLGAVLRISDPSTALGHFDEVRTIGQRIGDPALHAFGTYAYGLLLAQQGGARSGLDMLEQGIEALRAMPDVDRRRLNDTQGVFDPAAIPGAPRGGDAHVREGEARVDTDMPELLIGDIDRLGVLALLRATMGQPHRALSILDDLTRRAPLELSSTHRFAGHFFRAQGYALALVGRPSASVDAFRRSCSAFETGVHYLQWLQSAASMLDTAVHPYLLDDLPMRDGLMQQASRAGELSADVFPSGLSYHHLLLSENLLNGDWDEMAGWISAANLRSGSVAIVQQIHRDAALLARCQGRPDDARRHIAAVLPRGPETEPGDCPYETGMRLLILAAHVELDAGNLVASGAWLACMERWIDWSDVTLLRSESLLARARFHLHGGATGPALSLVDAVVESIRSLPQQSVEWEAHMLRADILLAGRSFQESMKHARHARDCASRCRMPYEAALAGIALASSCVATGAFAEAQSHLRDARRIVERVSAAPAIERIAAIEQTISSRLGRATYPAGLSAREAEVLRLVARGMSDADVGDELSISPRTVSQHLRSVYNKLGVSSRVAASRFAVENGLS